MRPTILLLLSGLATCALHTHASGADKLAGGTLSIYLENDLFAGTDRQYTSGVKVSWSSSDLANYSDSPYASPFLPLFNALPYINETTGFVPSLIWMSPVP